MESKFLKLAKPYLAVILLQFGYAAFAIICKSALNQGMNHYTFSVYRNAIATVVVAPFAIFFERNSRPRMTFSILYKIILLGLLEPVIDQNLYFAGMKYTSATYTTAMSNVVPAMTFLLAWILKLEKVKMKKLHSQAKIAGTLISFGGAIVMSVIKGPTIRLPWIPHTSDSQFTNDNANALQNPMKGSLMIAAGCVCWAIFYNLQAITLKSYPAVLSLTSLICMFGALQGAVLTLVAERGNFGIWSIKWDITLLAYVYGGIICSGVGYYVSGSIMKEKGPVFVTSFSPLNMIIVAVLSSVTLSEQLHLGKVLGAITIVIGLYLFIWGKTKDKDQSSCAATDLTHNHELPTSTRQCAMELQNEVV